MTAAESEKLGRGSFGSKWPKLIFSSYKRHAVMSNTDRDWLSASVHELGRSVISDLVASGVVVVNRWPVRHIPQYMPFPRTAVEEAVRLSIPKTALFLDKYFRDPLYSVSRFRTIWDRSRWTAGMAVGGAWLGYSSREDWPKSTRFVEKTPWEKAAPLLVYPYVFRPTNSPFIFDDPANPAHSLSGEEVLRNAAQWEGRAAEGMAVSALYGLGFYPGWGSEYKAHQERTALAASGLKAPQRPLAWYQASQAALMDYRVVERFKEASDAAARQMMFGTAPGQVPSPPMTEAERDLINQMYPSIVRRLSGRVGEALIETKDRLPMSGDREEMLGRLGGVPGRSLNEAARRSARLAEAYKFLSRPLTQGDFHTESGDTRWKSLQVPLRYFDRNLGRHQRRERAGPGDRMFPGADFKSLREGLARGLEPSFGSVVGFDNRSILAHVELRRKIKRVYDRLLEQGGSPQMMLERHAPAGVADEREQELIDIQFELREMMDEDARHSAQFETEYGLLFESSRAEAGNLFYVLKKRLSAAKKMGRKQALQVDKAQNEQVRDETLRLLPGEFDRFRRKLQSKLERRKRAYQSQLDKLTGDQRFDQIPFLDMVWDQERLELEGQLRRLDEYQTRTRAYLMGVEYWDGRSGRTPVTGSAAGGLNVRNPFPGFNQYLREWWGDEGFRKTRQEVLKRDSKIPVTLDRRGRVIGGYWVDAFTGEGLSDPRQVQIDHVVPVSEAYQAGGYGWGKGDRLAFMNDPDNLVVTSKNENQRKGRLLAGGYLPPKKELRAGFLGRVVKVKDKYGLALTEEELASVTSGGRQPFRDVREGAYWAVGRPFNRAVKGMGRIIDRAKDKFGMIESEVTLMDELGTDSGSVNVQILKTLERIEQLLGSKRGTGGRRQSYLEGLTEEMDSDEMKRLRKIWKIEDVFHAADKMDARALSREGKAIERARQGRVKDIERREAEALKGEYALDKFDAERWAALVKGIESAESKAFKRDSKAENAAYKARQDSWMGRQEGVEERQIWEELDAYNELLRRQRIGLELTRDITDSIVRGMSDALRYARELHEVGLFIAADLLRTFGRNVVEGFASKIVGKLAGALFGGATGGLDVGSQATGAGAVGKFHHPGLQHGGKAEAGMPYTVGESGKELFVPDQTGQVFSRSQTQKILGGDQHFNFEFNITGSDAAAVRAVLDAEVPKIVRAAVEGAYGLIAADHRRPSRLMN